MVGVARALNTKSVRRVVSAVHTWLVFASLLLAPPGAPAQQQSAGTLRGTVTDELGGIVVGATVTAADAAGVERSTTTNEQGHYAFAALAPGRYTLRASAPGFALFERTDVEVAAGRDAPLDVTLSATIEQETVTVTAEAPVSTDPEQNAGAVTLRGADLDALPDDPDDLAEALQALAGPSAGANGGEIFLDGFTGGRLPPKESIREVRINRNPFSAEYDRLGLGRIEIFTKPGTDRLRGQLSFNFNDESLNARNPFAPRRAPYQSRRYGGNLSGPLVSKRASFFLDFERRETDEDETINALVLDPALNVVPFNQTLISPARRTTFSPRLDYQLNQTNTLVARYTYERVRRENAVVGELSLPSRAFNVESRQHTFQATETAVIRQRYINETRFQFIRDTNAQTGLNSAPTIRVAEAFTGGGASVGRARNEADRFELSNYTSWAVSNHALKAGARLRVVRVNDVSPQNFAGTFTFTSLGQYAAVLAGQPGARPAQFSLAAGNPEARVSRTDFSPFVQDDWRVRPNLTLSLGLRYETQTNIESNLNFAPRLAFAWSPGAGGGGGGRQQQTVIRGGFGIFYERFAENLTLQATRFNGENQQQFIITGATEAGATLLGLFPVVPTVEQLTAFRIAQTVRRVAPGLQAPYTMQTALSVERQLPYRFTVSVNFVNARTLHVLRSRNANAFLPELFVRGQRVRPDASAGNVYQYESSGRFNQNQLILSVNNRFSRRFSFFGNYTLNRARSDTEGPNSFPVNQYDLSGEYGRSAQDIRHRLFLGGAVNALPWGLRLNPFVVANSGRPFNIIIGRDINGDTLFTERPAFADAQTPAADLRATRFGNFDVNPKPGQTIIPRNYGTGPMFFTVNLRASKSIGFGEVVNAAAGRQGGGGGRGGGGRGGGGRGGRGGGGRGGGGGGGGE